MEIQLKYITKTYDGEVLKGISLTICQGDYISITGRSGSGKTTPALSASPALVKPPLPKVWPSVLSGATCLRI